MLDMCHFVSCPLPHLPSLPLPLSPLPILSLPLCPLLPLSIIYLLVNRSKAEQLIKFEYSGPSRSSKYPHSFPWSIFCYILLLNTLVLYFCYLVLLFSFVIVIVFVLVFVFCIFCYSFCFLFWIFVVRLGMPLDMDTLEPHKCYLIPNHIP